MANPYTRQSSFSDGDTINSALFNDEYDQLVLSFSNTVGHTHDGSSGEGAPITKLGPAQDVVIAVGSMLPKTNNTVDLGSSSLKFKDGYFAGNVTVDGVVTHSGNMIIGDAATDTLTINATIQGSSLIFEGATANAHELTLAIPDVGSDVTVTLPSATDTLVGKATTDVLTNKTLTSPVINTGVSGSAILDSDTMSGASATTLSSSESIKAYVDTVMLTEDTLAELNDTNITSAADASLLLYDTGTATWRDAAMSGDATIGDTGVITLTANSVDSAEITAGAIDLAHMSVNSIDSDQYVDGSIDTAHIDNLQVTTAKIAADAITAAKLADDAVVTANIVDANVTGGKIANDAIDSQHYAADSIDSEHYAAGSVDATAIGNDVVNSQHYAAASIDNEHLADNAVDSAEIAAGAIDTAHITDDQVTYAKIQNVSADERILGRVSGANGVIEELTKAQVLTFANVEDGADVTDSTNVVAALTAGTGITISSGGTVAAGPIALTTVQTAANQVAHLALTAEAGDVVVRSDENKSYMHNGGSAGTMGDYTLLATPTDSVLSVNGVTGAITAAHIATAVEAASDSNTFTDADHTKLNAIAASANNYVHPNHSGDVVSAADGAMTIQTDAVDIAMLSATGTASSTTFLRGDNTWDVPIGGVTSVNSVTGAVTAAHIATAVEAASDSNTFTDADHTKLNAIAASANNYVHPNHSGDVVSAADGATTIQAGAVDIAMLSASGTASSSTFLRGDNSWVAVTTDLVGDTTPQLGGFLDTNGNYIQTEKGADIASASPTVITTVGDYFDVTGTTNFSAFTVAADRQFTLQFDGILTMTHHATNLDLPGEANITTAAGDVATFQSTGANTVQCINYTRADGTPLVGGATATLGFFEHTHTISSNLTITTDYNAISGGPITVATGSSVTVPSGSTWTIV